MRAAFYDEHGDADKLQVGDRPKPEPGPGEVLVRNHAAAVGAWDVYVMTGAFGDPSLPMIPSSEVAGVVEAAGDGAGFTPGDEVIAFLGREAGGLAEYSTAAGDRVVRKPATVSFAEAAALVVGPATAYEGLVDRARVKPRETVLITGASGGVGTSAVQVAAAAGATVLGVASARNHDYVRDLGASETFDYADPDWVAGVPEGVDVLFDATGQEARDRAVAAIKEGGRAVFIAGPSAELRPDIQPYLFSVDITRARLEAITRLVEEGKLEARIEAELPLERAAEAIAHVARGHTRGRVVLTIR